MIANQLAELTIDERNSQVYDARWYNVDGMHMHVLYIVVVLSFYVLPNRNLDLKNFQKPKTNTKNVSK